MMRRTVYLFSICLIIHFFICSPSAAKTIVLGGKLDSAINVTQHIQFTVNNNLSKLVYKLPLPGDFSNRTMRQSTSKLDIQCDPRPSNAIDEIDEFGNRYRQLTWNNITSDVQVKMVFDAHIKVELHAMESRTPFPLSTIPSAEMIYLKPTRYVQSNNPEIASKAKILTEGASNQYEAVTAIVNYVVDKVKYTYNPSEYDALNTLRTGVGNCTNYAHLSLALLRASGIPARIVAGITLNKHWRVPIENQQSIVSSMGQGKHAWIEIYFPDLGWLSYDPAQSKQFTSSRHIKETHGLDYHDIVGSWSGMPYAPRYSNRINAHFLDDNITLTSISSHENPKSYIYSNKLLAKAEASLPTLPEPSKPLPVIPIPIPEEKLKPAPIKPSLRPIEPPEPIAVKPVPPPVKPPEPIPVKPVLPPIEKPKPLLMQIIEFGNVDFPALVDTYKIVGNVGMETLDAETAEYVTSRHIYAQAFKTDKPLRVNNISLAMHKFGGDGTMYIDLVSDENGKPGLKGVRSFPLFLDRIKKRQGYYWIEFKFPDDDGHTMLRAGKYWIVLRHSGEAVMTWFYTPGKGYGDSDDTRSTLKGYRWEDILRYDFVFKVRGKRP